ncbi:MAG TPA: signal peptidase I [Dongiaceae bacterium]|nr:signal peptidase I [Dongiaceae bacterium]
MKVNAPLRRLGIRFTREWLIPFALVFAVVAPLKSAIVDWEYVPTGSMMPSIVPVELILVNKLAFDLKVPFTTRHVAKWGDPQRDDVVVFFSPADGMRLVKRVVGLPGDVVSMDRERLTINGSPIEYTAVPPGGHAEVAGALSGRQALFAVEHLGIRPHEIMILPQRAALRTFGPVRVPAGCYFVMGDNRDNSNDSRFIGCVARERIVGRAAAIIASVDPDRWGEPRFGRFLQEMP